MCHGGNLLMTFIIIIQFFKITHIGYESAVYVISNILIWSMADKKVDKWQVFHFPNPFFRILNTSLFIYFTALLFGGPDMDFCSCCFKGCFKSGDGSTTKPLTVLGTPPASGH